MTGYSSRMRLKHISGDSPYYYNSKKSRMSAENASTMTVYLEILLKVYTKLSAIFHSYSHTWLHCMDVSWHLVNKER